MSVFIVVSSVPSNSALSAIIADKFPKDDVLTIAQNQWLISAEMTTQQLSERLGQINHAVFSINNYFGRHSPEMWEWLKIKMEKN